MWIDTVCLEDGGNKIGFVDAVEQSELSTNKCVGVPKVCVR